MDVKFEKDVFIIVSNDISKDDIKNYFEFLNKKFGYDQSSSSSEEDDEKDSAEQAFMAANARMILYNPAERNLVGNLSEATASLWSAGIPLPKPLLEYMGLFERATKLFPRYEIPVFNVNYVKKDNKKEIAYSEYINAIVLEKALQGEIEYQLETHEIIPTRDKMKIVSDAGEDTLLWESPAGDNFYYQVVSDDFNEEVIE